MTGVEPAAGRQWAVAFSCTFLLLLPATAAMGATLPAIGAPHRADAPTPAVDFGPKLEIGSHCESGHAAHVRSQPAAGPGLFSDNDVSNFSA